MFRLVKYSSKFTIKPRDRWRHQKRLWRHHVDLSKFWFGTKNLTLIYNLSHQYVIFFKNFGNDVTNNDVINFKINFFKPELENQLLFKTRHLYNF